MSNEEYRDFLIELENDKKMSNLSKVKSAYDKSQFLFKKCVSMSKLSSADRNIWGNVIGVEDYEAASHKLSLSVKQSELYVGRLWRCVLQTSKYLSDGVSRDYAKYFCTLVDYSTGSQIERLSLLYFRDKTQFDKLAKMCDISSEELEVVNRHVFDFPYGKIRGKSDLTSIKRTHEEMLRICREVVSEY